MKSLLILLVILSVGCVYAGKGDIISEFTLSGQPVSGVRGLAYDPSDGNIWAAGPNAVNDVIFAKFDIVTHEIVQNWQNVQSQYWVFDIGWKYKYNGIDCLVMVDQNLPRIRLINPSDGSFMGYLPDSFNGGYDEGMEGDYDNNWGVTLYSTNYSYEFIMKWNGSSWADWGPTLYPVMGCAYGWAHVFFIHTSPTYQIRSIKTSDGFIEEDIPLKNWGTCYMVGLSRGRDNYYNTEDTLFVACFYPANVIREVSIGNYNQTDITPTSVGSIKSMFK